MSSIEAKMKPIILYSTVGGNTEKVAREIASELNCHCVKVSKNFDSSSLDLNNYDLVFVGTGIYAGKPNRQMLDYLQKTIFGKSLQFAVFLTWYGRGKIDIDVFEKIKGVLNSKEQKVSDSYYKCYGEARSNFERGFASFMGSVSAGHPDASDLSAARKWSREIIETAQQKTA